METSNIVYVRGINKQTSREDIHEHFCHVGAIANIDFTELPKRQGHCWITYQESSAASKSVQDLHHSMLRESCLSVRLESVSGKVHQSSVITPKVPKTLPAMYCAKLAVYTSKSIRVENMEYPFPQGIYLMKLFAICHSSVCLTAKQQIVDMIIANLHGNNSQKEISESMAMVNGLHQLSHKLNLSWTSSQYSNSNVFVVGDGKYPLTASILSLFLPSSWKFASIDPLMSIQSTDECINGTQIFPHAQLSQDFDIDAFISLASDRASHEDLACKRMNIVIACHSHAPLEEFWTRVPCPKCCVSMPCCGKNWSVLCASHSLSTSSASSSSSSSSSLASAVVDCLKEACPSNSNSSMSDHSSTVNTILVDSYADYEVYSPKRTLHLYCSRDVMCSSDTTLHSL